MIFFPPSSFCYPHFCVFMASKILLAHIALVAPAMSSAEESDDEPPACCFFQAADPPQASELLAYNPDHHFEMPLEAPAAHNATHDWSAVSNTSRGGYSRDGAAKRGSHADQAHGFWETVSSTALAGACKPGCALDCTGRVSRNEMLTCIAASYGTVTFTSDEQLKIEKRRPGNSYGKNIQHDGEAGRWMCTTKSRETGDGWAQLFDSFVAFLPDGSAATTYRVAGHQTCANFTRCAYGIPETTWLHGLAAARRQPGGAVIARQQSFAGQSTAGVDRQETVSSTSEAIGWWVDLFAEWDKLPNESPPVIKYPPYVGEALYSEVYVPEMELYSMAPPLKQNDGKAPGSWFRAREAAVLEFSLTEFGLKEGTATGGLMRTCSISNAPHRVCAASDAPHRIRHASSHMPSPLPGEPKHRFRLVERANHSNFPECDTCRSNRKEKEQNIIDRAPRERRNATSAKQVAHIREIQEERNVTSAWVREANRSNTQLSELDDKLGSHWNFLPMPPNGRFAKVTSGRYRYRQCVMANLYPGVGNFYSFVPPFLKTGNNFGCTAFCVSLCRLIQSGKLAPSITTITRQTDGGPDIDGKTTHAIHYALVREGACNRLLWGKLRSGHSHNWADFTFAESKTIFYPRSGAGPGCPSPMQYHAALTDGLKTLPGGLEIMWQLANFDFDKFAATFMNLDEFTRMSGERLWCYEYDSTLSDLYVRCTFKSKLNDVASSSKAEWKPHLPPNDSGWQETDREGLIFVKKDAAGKYLHPNFTDPGLDKWDEAPDGDERPADASGWQRDKVIKVPHPAPHCAPHPAAPRTAPCASRTGCPRNGKIRRVYSIPG